MYITPLHTMEPDVEHMRMSDTVTCGVHSCVCSVPAPWFVLFSFKIGVMIVLLVGMRGVGKSTLLSSIEKDNVQLRYVATDMDEVFSATKKVSIGDFVETHGWEAFRKVELECLRGAISENASCGDGDVIIATGGGIVDSKESVEYLLSIKNSLSTVIIHVRRTEMHPLFEFLSDIRESDPRRPRLPSFYSPQEIWEKRRPLYDLVSIYDFYLHTDSDLLE